MSVATFHPVPLLIRPASAADGPALRAIERSAGERFRDIGMPEIADDEPLPEETLNCYADEGRSWVAIDDEGEPIGYVLVDLLDGNAHIEQVSVDPAYQGTGVGRALLEQVRQWACAAGLGAVTLTTFTDVPWNAPLYRHLGFQVLEEDDVGPELKAARMAEAARGLDNSIRCCMRREVAG